MGMLLVVCTFKKKNLSSVGHGRSEGDRVHVETFDTYVQDVIQHVERMKQEHPDVPCLLMGHSMVSTHCHACMHTNPKMVQCTDKVKA